MFKLIARIRSISIWNTSGPVTLPGQTEKVSAWTTMAQIFTGGGRFSFFLLKTFYTQIQYANLYFSRPGNSNSGSLAARRTSLPWRVAQAGRVCWTVGHVRVTSSSPLSRASSARAPLDRFSKMMWKRHGASLLLLRQGSGVKTWRLVIPKRNPQHREQSATVASSSMCRRRLLEEGFLTDTATGIAVDEKQLISWARMNWPKKIIKDRYNQFRSWSWSSKSQEAKKMHDLLQPQKLCCVDRVSSHISTRAWIAAQKPWSTVKISFSFLDFYLSTSFSRSRSTRQLVTHGAAPKRIGRKVEKSVRSALQNTVGWVSRSRDLFLFRPDRRLSWRTMNSSRF